MTWGEGVATALLSLGLVGVVWISWQLNEWSGAREDSCREQGGTMVSSRHGDICIRAERLSVSTGESRNGNL